MSPPRRRAKKKGKRPESVRAFPKWLCKEIDGFIVKSLANGEFTITASYRAEPLEPGATVHGVVTRMSFAAEIQKLLNRAREVKP